MPSYTKAQGPEPATVEVVRATHPGWQAPKRCAARCPRSPRTSTNSVGEVDLDHSTDGAALHAGRRRGAPSAGFQRLLLRGFVGTTCQKGALESQR